MKRSIRLKEFLPKIELVHIPTQEYLRKTPLLDKNRVYFQKTDENGFMKSHLTFNSDVNVVIIGDSFIENIFVDESKRIAAMVEKSFLAKGKKVKILNAGVSGATGLTLLNTILNKIVFLKPDFLIYCQPSCDFSALIYENGYFNNSKYFSNFIPQADTDKFHFETISNNLYQLENIIFLIIKACELWNIPLCFATCCSNSSKRQLKMMNDIIRNNSNLGYDIIDLDLIIEKSEKYFYDKQHLNSQGAQYVSNIFFQYLDSKINIEESNISLKEKELSFKPYTDLIMNATLHLNNDSTEQKTLYLVLENLSNKNNIFRLYRNNEQILSSIELPPSAVLEFSTPISNGNEFESESISLTLIGSDLFRILDSKIISLSE